MHNYVTRGALVFSALLILLLGCTESKITEHKTPGDPTLDPTVIALQDNTINVHNNYFSFVNGLYGHMGNILTSMELMNSAWAETFSSALEFANEMGKPFAADAEFSEFQLNNSPSDVLPPFSFTPVLPPIGQPQLTQYFLLSSDSKLFTEKNNTVKTFFTDPLQFSSAWTRAFNYHARSVFYISLEKIAANGRVKRLKYPLMMDFSNKL